MRTSPGTAARARRYKSAADIAPRGTAVSREGAKWREKMGDAGHQSSLTERGPSINLQDRKLR